MISKIISDISDFIFVSDKPQKADAIFLPVAQLDRVPDSDSVGRRFESCWAGQKTPSTLTWSFFIKFAFW